MKQNAIIYTRVSTGDQNTQRQVNDLKKYAEYKNYNVIEVFEDVVSGSTKLSERDSYDKLRKVIDGYDFDVNHILVSELSRLGRNMKDVILTVNYFTELGINIHIQKPEMDTCVDGKTNPMTSIIISVLAGFAEIERETIRERVKSGLRNSRLGNSAQGVPPMGYMNKDGKLVVNPEEKGAVEKMFSLYLRGESSAKITETLNDLKIKTRYSKKNTLWSNKTVIDVLKNPIYRGHRMINFGNDIVEIERIVSPQDFERVQELIKKNTSRRTKYNINLLEHIIVCGNCGKSFYLHRRKDKKDNSYKCLSTKVRPKCGSKGVNIDTLNSLVYEYVLCYFKDANKDAIRSKAQRDLKEFEERDKDNYERIMTYKAKRERYKKLYIDGYISFEEYTANNKLLMDKQINAFKENQILMNEQKKLKAMIDSELHISEYSPTEVYKLKNEIASTIKSVVISNTQPTDRIVKECSKSFHFSKVEIIPIVGKPSTYIIPTHYKCYYDNELKRHEVTKLIDISK